MSGIQTWAPGVQKCHPESAQKPYFGPLKVPTSVVLRHRTTSPVWESCYQLFSVMLVTLQKMQGSFNPDCHDFLKKWSPEATWVTTSTISIGLLGNGFQVTNLSLRFTRLCTKMSGCSSPYWKRIGKLQHWAPQGSTCLLNNYSETCLNWTPLGSAMLFNVGRCSI